MDDLEPIMKLATSLGFATRSLPDGVAGLSLKL